MDKKDTRVIVKRILKDYIYQHKVKLLVSFFCMALIAAATAGNAWLMQPVLDEIFINKNQKLIFIIPIIVFLIALTKGIASYFQSILMSFVGYKMVAQIQKDMFENLIRCDLSYFNQTNSGTLVSRFISDVGSISRGIHNVIVNIIKDSLTFIFLIGVMFYHDTKLAVISLFIFPLAIYPISRIGKRLRKISKNTQVGFGLLTSKLAESIGSIKTIKSFNNETHETQKISKEIDNIFNLTFKSTKVNSISRPLMETLGGLAIAIIIFIGGSQVIMEQTTPGTFFSFLTALLMAYQPVKSLATLNATLQIAMASAERIFEILDEKPQIKNLERTEDHKFKSIKSQNLKISNLSFKYNSSEKLILKDINLEILDGEKIAIVGYSGAGKTTLMNLLPRFFDPNKGQITIGGINIKNLSLEFLRNHFSLVSQDIVLFDQTLQYNVSYGKDRVLKKDIELACRKANCYEFINKFPNKLNQQIGEDGTKLSGGQKQRVAIARAFLKNAPFLLLDEATSSLDSKSESRINKSLDSLMNNRTTLVIAHRLSTIINADRIVILHNGRVADIGTHKNLLKKSGIYKDLYELQFKNKNAKKNTST